MSEKLRLGAPAKSRAGRSLRAGAPVSAHWIADRQSGPLINKFGTEAHRRFYLPRICAAQAFFCIGMSEPNSGSDLASVGTRASKCQDGWRLNGPPVQRIRSGDEERAVLVDWAPPRVPAIRDGPTIHVDIEGQSVEFTVAQAKRIRNVPHQIR